MCKLHDGVSDMLLRHGGRYYRSHGHGGRSRTRKWDSCFTMDFSYIHGGSVRPSSKGRYRHWLTHKLASWVDQFGTIGCVGCGRCITWCPVGIDITEEFRVIRETYLMTSRVSSTKETTHGNS